MPVLGEVKIQRGLDGTNGSKGLQLGRVLHGESDSFANLQRASRDTQLLIGLQDKDRRREPMAVTSWGLRVRHPGLEPLLTRSYNPDSLDKLRQRLAEAGTFNLHTQKEHSVTVDGEKQQITIVKATPVEAHGDMDGKVWIRDQNEAVKTALKKLRYEPNPSRQDEDDTRDLLFSTMHLMSTRPQLDRFAAIIADNTQADNYLAWPQIAMEITPDDRKLESIEPTNWRQTQEAFQKLALSVFDALDIGLITVDQLKDGNKQFLASLMPFLAAVDFTRRPSSGPWEEQMAVRTSVFGVETALLHKIREYAAKPGFEFLEKGFTDTREQLLQAENTSFSDEPVVQQTTFDQALGIMINKGLATLGQKIPKEAPDEPGTIRYRTADIALLDLLDYGIPELLVRYQIGIEAFGGETRGRMDIENLILDKIGELRDEETNCLFRYGVNGEPQDTYLRGNYATDGIQWWINRMKSMLADEAKEGQINLDEKAELREQITDGKSAAWLHPNFGIAAWASEMALKLRLKQQEGIAVTATEIDHYKQIADEMLNRAAAGLTGPDEHDSLLNGDNTHHIEQVGELQATECWTTMYAPDGSKIIVASPNTPLEWGATLADRAFAIHSKTLLALAA